MPYLQPYHLFIAETTRLNELYWTSKYAYTRVSAILKVISDTGKSDKDPRVDALWASVDEGETKHISRPLSGFVEQLELNAVSLRTTSILHICSAFETCISNYFALCALYLPQKANPAYTGSAVPDVLKDQVQYLLLKNAVIKQATDKLRGLYTKRLAFLLTTFDLPALTTPSIHQLDEHYAKRHLIAHDQSLAAADAPDLSAKEIIQSQIKIDESTWKGLIKDFHSTLVELDELVRTHIVKDMAISIAIQHIVQQDAPVKLDDLKSRLTEEWKIGTLPTSLVKSTAESLDLQIEKQFGELWVLKTKRPNRLITHLLFDFFGTLVTYSESRTEQGYERSHAVLLAHGATLDYATFLERWENTGDQFELAAETNYDEYSMDAVVTAFLTDVFGIGFTPDLANNFRDIYLQEWSKGVKYIEGARILLEQLKKQYTLVLVTNTHRAEFVRTHLQNMQITDCFSLIVTSVEHGKRKPHPSIFQVALQATGGESDKALYIGDSYTADYLGANSAGIRCLLIDPHEKHNIAPQDRIAHLLNIQQVLDKK